MPRLLEEHFDVITTNAGRGEERSEVNATKAGLLEERSEVNATSEREHREAGVHDDAHRWVRQNRARAVVASR